jgi:hypothetical protein
MIQYQNGNSTIELSNDGTRVITFEDTLQLEYPLNIDIRVSTKCAFGFNPKTGKAVCDFCHESARTDGNECDYQSLQNKLIGLPKGIELAVGANQLTQGLYDFINWCDGNGYVVNLTLNQGHIKRDQEMVKKCYSTGIIKGLGISYRSSLKWDIPQFVLDNPNTVFHVIAGIDDVNEVLSLKDKGVKKILVLGEKNFGFNEGKVDLTTKKHKEWLWFISKLFHTFDVTSFDNLGLEQLRVKRFFNNEMWDEFNQGEHSFYINAVDNYFAPSSRSNNKTNWNEVLIEDYFKQLNK